MTQRRSAAIWGGQLEAGQGRCLGGVRPFLSHGRFQELAATLA